MAEMDRNDEATVEECRVCGGEIYIDSECEEDDLVYCNDCEAEYLVRSLDPVRLKLMQEEHCDDDTDFDEEDE